jgi:pimeloyl-ACP methyl ester carboxylesterase
MRAPNPHFVARLEGAVFFEIGHNAHCHRAIGSSQQARSMKPTQRVVAAFVLMLLVLTYSEANAMGQPVSYHSIKIDGLSIFYREAGAKDAPVILLLHGLPSSSRMYESLLQRLGDQIHLIAPDYPGFGHSDWPSPKEFVYTFDRIADVMDHFVVAMGISQYSLYLQDYGGPVGFRLALAHPERVRSLIIQNAVAHDTGLGPNWKVRRQFWTDRAAYEAELRKNLLSLETTRVRHLGSDPATELYDPDLWTDEFSFLNQPGQADIQADLFYDYRTNVASYSKWQAWMLKNQPRLLIIWGRYDPSFDISEPEAYRRDVPTATVQILDGGHFALDTKADEIAVLVRRFAAH